MGTASSWATDQLSTQTNTPGPETGQMQSHATTDTGFATNNSNPAEPSAAPLLEGGQNKQTAEETTKQEGHSIPETPAGYELRFGEGVEVDSTTLESFKTIAHEQGLSQQQAANLASFYASVVGRQTEIQTSALMETEQGWISTMQREGNFAGTVANARLAMERFGSDELASLFNATRLGSHPALVRFVANVGKALGEPASMRGTGAMPSGLNFYPTMNKD